LTASTHLFQIILFASYKDVGLLDAGGWSRDTKSQECSRRQP